VLDQEGIEATTRGRKERYPADWAIKRRTIDSVGGRRLYYALNIVRVINSRRMRWTGHLTRMAEKRGCTGSWWGNRREGDHWRDLGVDGRIILERISKR